MDTEALFRCMPLTVSVWQEALRLDEWLRARFAGRAFLWEDPEFGPPLAARVNPVVLANAHSSVLNAKEVHTLVALYDSMRCHLRGHGRPPDQWDGWRPRETSDQDPRCPEDIGHLLGLHCGALMLHIREMMEHGYITPESIVLGHVRQQRRGPFLGADVGSLDHALLLGGAAVLSLIRRVRDAAAMARNDRHATPEEIAVAVGLPEWMVARLSPDELATVLPEPIEQRPPVLRLEGHGAANPVLELPMCACGAGGWWVVEAERWCARVPAQTEDQLLEVQPAPAWWVSLRDRADQVVARYVIDGIHEMHPVLFFDPVTGRQVVSVGSVPAQALEIVHPMANRPALVPGSADAVVVQPREPEPLTRAWRGFGHSTVRHDGAAAIVFGSPPQSDEERWAHRIPIEAGPGHIHLDRREQIPGVVGPSGIPVFRRMPQLDVRAVTPVERRWWHGVVTIGERHIDVSPSMLRRHGPHLLRNLAAIDAAVVVEVRLLGPVGRELCERFVVVPGVPRRDLTGTHRSNSATTPTRAHHPIRVAEAEACDATVAPPAVSASLKLLAALAHAVSAGSRSRAVIADLAAAAVADRGQLVQVYPEAMSWWDATVNGPSLHVELELSRALRRSPASTQPTSVSDEALTRLRRVAPVLGAIVRGPPVDLLGLYHQGEYLSPAAYYMREPILDRSIGRFGTMPIEQSGAYTYGEPIQAAIARITARSQSRKPTQAAVVLRQSILSAHSLEHGIAEWMQATLSGRFDTQDWIARFAQKECTALPMPADYQLALHTIEQADNLRGASGIARFPEFLGAAAGFWLATEDGAEWAGELLHEACASAPLMVQQVLVRLIALLDRPLDPRPWLTAYD